MIYHKLRLQRTLVLGLDLALTYLALILAYHLRFTWEIVPVTKGVPPFEPYLALIPIITLVWPVVFYFRGLLTGRPRRSRIDEVLAVLTAVALAMLVLNAGLAFYRGFSYSRLTLALFAALDFALVALGRLLFWFAMGKVWAAPHRRQRAVVVGTGELAKAVAEKLSRHRELGLDVVGFVEENGGARGKVGEWPVLGGLGGLERLVRDHQVELLYVALPLRSQHKVTKILRVAEALLLDVRVVPDLLQYYALRAGVEDLDGIPVINLTAIPLAGWNSFIKRSVDLTLSFLGLLFLWPVMAVIALAIYLQDRGPIFYRQLRMGLDGRPFWILKFRTMVVDAEKLTGPRFAQPNDPRVTPVGAFLRRYSLDELPQLWNVLKGEMSLVGPRPERPEFVARFRQRFPEYMARHRVKAGLTGWAQVNDLRGQSSLRKRIAYDLYYIDNWSLALDFKILFLTLVRFWRHRHAY
ncbi:MAG: undecaprenyl-phosphate glucose phosphotransferase [Thermoanaerobaculum sp.]|nr:undecaprenyl-phosphate glucose phosphotransferase [Thermoanaerobaculum sp.]